jgi:hypothetical protein
MAYIEWVDNDTATAETAETVSTKAE